MTDITLVLLGFIGGLLVGVLLMLWQHRIDMAKKPIVNVSCDRGYMTDRELTEAVERALANLARRSRGLAC